MKKAIIIIVILAIIGGGAFALVQSSDKSGTTNNSAATNTQSTPSTSSSTPSSSETNNSNTSNEATITYTDDGYSPSTLTVKAGTVVTIKNNSSSDMEFSSDSHPVHTDDPELNMEVVGPGESTTLTPTVKGTHGYHDHLNSTHTGTLIVQ